MEAVKIGVTALTPLNVKAQEMPDGRSTSPTRSACVAFHIELDT